jgi:predicted tellurium resistance membrane protein TerC
VIDIVFSLDSVITAIGMVQTRLEGSLNGWLAVVNP